jgi:hypothetical protein
LSDGEYLIDGLTERGYNKSRSVSIGRKFIDYRRKVGVEEVIPGNRRSRVNSTLSGDGSSPTPKKPGACLG